MTIRPAPLSVQSARGRRNAAAASRPMPRRAPPDHGTRQLRAQWLVGPRPEDEPRRNGGDADVAQSKPPFRERSTADPRAVLAETPASSFDGNDATPSCILGEADRRAHLHFEAVDQHGIVSAGRTSAYWIRHCRPDSFAFGRARRRQAVERPPTSDRYPAQAAFIAAARIVCDPAVMR